MKVRWYIIIAIAVILISGLINFEIVKKLHRFSHRVSMKEFENRAFHSYFCPKCQQGFMAYYKFTRYQYWNLMRHLKECEHKGTVNDFKM